MSFSRYPKYKASGVGWLGDVPEHWTHIRYKNVFAEKQSVSGGSLPSGSISFGRVVFKSDAILNELTKDTYQEVLAGEFLINPINLNYDLKSLRTALSDINTCVSPAYIVLRAKTESDKTYLKYQLHLFDVFHMKTLGAGVRQTITFGDIGACPTFLPPLSEQTCIAAFLDSETAMIDGLVKEQQRLMELLKEKRQAVISHAVTKGLNADAPMKPSGIDWLGDMPEHWELKPLSYLCSKIGSGKTPLGGAEAYVNEGILFIRSQNVYDEGLFLDDVVYVTEATDVEMPWSRVLPGDILLNITGASLGRTCLVPDEFGRANVNQHVCILRLFDAALREYVAMVLKSSWMKAQFDSAQTGAAREGLNFSQISKFVLALPPAAEQATITVFLHQQTAQFDILTEEAQRAIDLLQERRTALISAAVTGQIDVRPAAVKVPA